MPVSISVHREFGAKREILIDGYLPESIETGRVPVFTIREIQTKIAMLKARNYSFFVALYEIFARQRD